MAEHSPPAQMSESESRFRAIFDESYQYIFLLEPDGTLSEANDTALAFGGVRLDEVIGRKIWDTPWWRGSEEACSALEAAVARAAAGELVHYDSELHGQGHVTVFVDLSLKPILNRGGNIPLLIAEARLANKRHHFYEIPIPDSFTAGPNKGRTREITIALAHCPPTRTTRLDYKAVRMVFKLVEGADLDAVSAMFDKATKDEDYENIPEMGTSQTRRAYGASRRSRGTVQAATWTLKRARKQKLFVVITRNDQGWSDIEDEEPYALTIRLSDRENEQARLYTQIQAQLQLRQRARLRGRVAG